MVEKFKERFREMQEEPVKALIKALLCFVITSVVLAVVLKNDGGGDAIFTAVAGGWMFGGMIYAWNLMPINLKDILFGGLLLPFPWSLAPWLFAFGLKGSLAAFSGLVLLPLSVVLCIIALVRNKR